MRIGAPCRRPRPCRQRELPSNACRGRDGYCFSWFGGAAGFEILPVRAIDSTSLRPLEATSPADREATILRLGLFLPTGFSVMSFAPIAAFEAANIVVGERFYDLRVLSERGEALTNSLGWQVNTEPLGEGRLDTLMAGSGPDLVSPSPRTVVLLRNALSTTRRITSICIAAYTLAEAGILDGRRATTHWSYAEELARRFPKINVEMDRIFIADGPVWTSAGMTAGIDPALGLIERDLGPTGSATHRESACHESSPRWRSIAAFCNAAARC